jgi:hypothetical protein
MRLIVTLLFISIISCISAQWKVKKVDNGFDTPFTVAYTDDAQSVFLKLENYKGVAFYLSNTYVCEETLMVDVSFLVNGEYSKYSVEANVSENKKIVFLFDDLSSEPDVLKDFKACTLMKIRVNDNTCDTEIYEFKMSGSTAAYDAVLKQ